MKVKDPYVTAMFPRDRRTKTGDMFRVWNGRLYIDEIMEFIQHYTHKVDEKDGREYINLQMLKSKPNSYGAEFSLQVSSWGLEVKDKGLN